MGGTAVGSGEPRRALGCLVVTLAGCTFSSVGGGGTAAASDSTGLAETTATLSTRGDPDEEASTGQVGASGDGDTGPGPTSAALDTTSGAETTEDGGESDGSTGAPLPCDRALFVTNGDDPPTGPDAVYHARLLRLDMDVTIVASVVAQASDVADNCVVVISASVSAADIAGEFHDASVPLLTWESAAYPDLRFVDPVAAGTNGVVEPADDVEIVDPAHPIAAGLSGTVGVFEGGGRIGWGLPAGEAQVVAIVPGDPALATVFAFDTGATMGGDYVAPARRVALPGGSTVAEPTDDALAIFEAALLWVES